MSEIKVDSVVQAVIAKFQEDAILYLERLENEPLCKSVAMQEVQASDPK